MAITVNNSPPSARTGNDEGFQTGCGDLSIIVLVENDLGPDLSIITLGIDYNQVEWILWCCLLSGASVNTNENGNEYC
jgi:hypothetical protein